MPLPAMKFKLDFEADKMSESSMNSSTSIHDLLIEKFV
jgi:hypothetical protein